MDPRNFQRTSAETVILALLEGRARHGYELAKLVESKSDSILQFQVASIYPMLYRLERKKLVAGKWIEKPGERRRRFYSLTAVGRKALTSQRKTWREFFGALSRLTGFDNVS